MRIELTRPAKSKLAATSHHHGMTQLAMMSRLVEFCAEQDESIQSAMIRRYPDEIQSDVAKLILKKSGK